MWLWDRALTIHGVQFLFGWGGGAGAGARWGTPTETRPINWHVTELSIH